MDKRFKAAIIGAGNIGFKYALDPLRNWVSTHLQAYREHPDFEPIAICDIDKTSLRQAGSYLPSLKLYTSWRDMLENEEIDILSICASPELNLKVCESPYLKYLKAIILEKPFARDIMDGRKIIKAIRERKIIAAVNYFRRWQNTFWALKDIISSGRIGKILKVNAYYPSGIWTGGSHMIDALHYLFGNFSRVLALSKTKVEHINDSLYSVFGYIQDIEVYLCGFKKSNFNIFEIEIWGQKGKIIISNFGKNLILKQAVASKHFSKQRELMTTKEAIVKEYNRYFINLLRNISGVLNNRENQVLCAPEDALRTTIVIRGIEESFKNEREISFIRR